MTTQSNLLCRSGRHAWLDAADRGYCCNGYRRLYSPTREGLAGCLRVRPSLLGYRGWERIPPEPTKGGS